MAERLLGVGADGARGGWIAVACFAEAPNEAARRTEVALCRSFSEVVALRGEGKAAMAVDMPMALLETVELRPCDRQARRLLGARWNTVFAPPSRPLLQAATYADARQLVAQLRESIPEAQSLSAQAFGLAPKIKEVDDWLQRRDGAQRWLYECHPELSFRAMAGGRALEAKRTAHGQADRLRLVVQAFPDAFDVIAETRLSAREADLIDILDAYAALESALRVAADDYEQIGGETDETGLVMRMVF